MARDGAVIVLASGALVGSVAVLIRLAERWIDMGIF